MTGVLLAAACASSPELEADDDAADAVAVGKGDGAWIAEGTPRAAGILRVANELSREALAAEAELTARAADGIVAGRPFATLAALDAVPHVGPVTFDKLLAAAEARGWVGPAACVVATGGSFALDIPTVRLSGQITIGRKVPPRGWDGGAISLQTAAGDRVNLGETGDGVYAVTMLPGTYEIIYEHGAGDAVPQNRRARLGSVTITGSRRLDIDVPVAAVTPAVTLDGAAPPPTGAELRLRRGDDEVPLGQIWETSRPVLVVPGTYDVEYGLDDARDEAAAIPRNRGTIVRRGVEIVARDQRLTVELGTAPVAARVAEGRALLAGVLIDATPTTMLRGDYDVEQWLSSFIHAVVSRVRIDGPTTVEVTTQARTLTTRVTVNGGEAPLGDGGVILLRRGKESIWLGRSTSRSFSTPLIAGQGPYDVVWSYLPSDFRAVEVPQNQQAVLARGVDVDALGELVVDLAAVSVSGRVSGAQAGDVVMLIAVDDPANRLAIRPAADGSFVTLALPGRYRAAYGSWQPNVTAAPFGEIITVSAPGTRLELTVPARPVASAVTFDGGAGPDGGWTLSFVSAGETVASFGGDPHGAKPLVPGRYDLVYAATSVMAGVPANQRALVGCLDVRAPD